MFHSYQLFYCQTNKTVNKINSVYCVGSNPSKDQDVQASRKTAFSWALSPVQTDATLLANNPNIVGCYSLCLFAYAVTCCCMLLVVVSRSLKLVKLLATCKQTQQFPTLSSQQGWELLCLFACSFLMPD